MGTRRGPGAWLSAEQAREQLALPCFYIIMGLAVPVFPESSTPAPSRVVYIVRNKPQAVPTNHLTTLMMTVNLEQWRTAVLPVIQRDEWDIRTPLMEHALCAGRLGAELEYLGEALYRSFVEAGYGAESP